ncbi:hypothetical protein GJ631_12520 [Natronomonas sp. CBA1123]|uniref:DUF7344 domain-containing protein n=1 Tax=Natronomonas sp. CBA1123 TaxID=2668070 RepID=UPI0012E9A0F1|nr:hypothetical protein [Natronomonas sp. CBA1123]MUV87363.1 hypothetical protein [Natronomonas sp. CBA1123]
MVAIAAEEGNRGGLDSNGSDDSESGALSTEAVFETLSSQRRRYTLHYLKQRGEPVTVRDLSEQVAAWENGIDRESVTPKLRKRVYTALYQTHLPKMSQLEVIEYDSDRGVVGMTPHVSQLDIYLDIVPTDDLPWSQFYLGLGAVFTALVTVAALGVRPFDLVPGFGYALCIALAVSGTAAYHTVRDRRTRLGGDDQPAEEIVPPLESHETFDSVAADD